ncbi:methionyl-tRNA formyltransferase [Microbacterium sp. SLBN-146]|uniref:methionyl-tRNA formyltransferase n=1 Tax=Microbacterium sp. SLBN-146 TaxID=2768457 RepID=UPI0011511E9B|nr:methionyl-tRNA formyltransferase [Microbacterium sp. SLBN-146]TQJ32198.1 methionyl-tRNA formyltransferase [Microbacterium sp. SLBN-146]
MRLVFAGTPEAAVPSLRALAESRHEIALVVTRTDARVGRKRILTPSPVAATAEDLGLEVYKTDRLDEAATARIADIDAGLGVIVAYGGLVREPLLSSPTHGWINLHFSLLPRWRGAAPVQRAVMAGDAVTGASVFRLVPELDAGDVYRDIEIPVPAGADSGSLLTTLSDAGASLLVDVVDAIANGTAVTTPQSGEATYAPKLGDDDGLVSWTETDARVLSRIRGVTPEPGARTAVAGARLKILEAREAGEGAPMPAPGVFVFDAGRVYVGTAGAPIELVAVQPAGRTAMRAPDWWRGLRTETLTADA